jgi:hypothetical protein
LPDLRCTDARSIRSPDERVRCWHEQFRRFRIPLGTIPGGEEPQDALEEVVGIERGLIFNGFWPFTSGA